MYGLCDIYNIDWHRLVNCAAPLQVNVCESRRGFIYETKSVMVEQWGTQRHTPSQYCVSHSMQAVYHDRLPLPTQPSPASLASIVSALFGQIEIAEVFFIHSFVIFRQENRAHGRAILGLEVPVSYMERDISFHHSFTYTYSFMGIGNGLRIEIFFQTKHKEYFVFNLQCPESMVSNLVDGFFSSRLFQIDKEIKRRKKNHRDDEKAHAPHRVFFFNYQQYKQYIIV